LPPAKVSRIPTHGTRIAGSDYETKPSYPHQIRFSHIVPNAGSKLSIDIEQHSIRSKTSNSLGKNLKFCTVHHICDILVVAV